jgi:hypothetical protein
MPWAVITAIPGGEDRGTWAAAPPEQQRAANSVPLLCSALDLRPAPGGWELVTKPFLCRSVDQPFTGEEGVRSRGSDTPATAVLVGRESRHALTVRHAVVDRYGRLLWGLRLAFGYRTSGGGAAPLLAAGDVRTVIRLVARGKGDDDWALLELDAPAARPGLPVRDAGAPGVGDPLLAIGYPHGLPVKLGPGRLRAPGTPNPLADLDIGAGNSGSPVLGLGVDGCPGWIEGLVRRAAPDLEPVRAPCSACEPGRRCAVWVNPSHPDDPAGWAELVPASTFRAHPEVAAVLHG